jgi:hypothetical protein
MRYALVMAVAAVAIAAGTVAASAQTRGRVIVVPNVVYGDAIIYPDVIVRRPVPLTIPALDGVRNGTTREERDIHGGPGEIYIPGWPSFRGPMLRRW